MFSKHHQPKKHARRKTGSRRIRVHENTKQAREYLAQRLDARIFIPDIVPLEPKLRQCLVGPQNTRQLGSTRFPHVAASEVQAPNHVVVFQRLGDCGAPLIAYETIDEEELSESFSRSFFQLLADD